ncbi:hypothetical protein C8Q78DRAFT_451004 [Trametes maxima]|nr:hypothetical protein C8Q78DRAFT_451004 [Trametes maxima]
MVHFDPFLIRQATLPDALVASQASLPISIEFLTSGPSRRATFPVTLVDRWNRGALEKYMQSIIDKTAYVQSDIECLQEMTGYTVLPKCCGFL